MEFQHQNCRENRLGNSICFALGGFGLGRLDHVHDGELPGQQAQDMDVVLDTADEYHWAVHFR